MRATPTTSISPTAEFFRALGFEKEIQTARARLSAREADHANGVRRRATTRCWKSRWPRSTSARRRSRSQTEFRIAGDERVDRDERDGLRARRHADADEGAVAGAAARSTDAGRGGVGVDHAAYCVGESRALRTARLCVSACSKLVRSRACSRARGTACSARARRACARDRRRRSRRCARRLSSSSGIASVRLIEQLAGARRCGALAEQDHHARMRRGARRRRFRAAGSCDR